MADENLEQLTRGELIAEVKKLRAGIRRHRDSTGHELCWHHPELWELLPEKGRSGSGRAGMASVLSRLCAIPGVAGCSTPERAAHER